eukprot:6195001-Pleurochrysis_carterae.AAC.2
MSTRECGHKRECAPTRRGSVRSVNVHARPGADRPARRHARTYKATLHGKIGKRASRCMYAGVLACALQELEGGGGVPPGTATQSCERRFSRQE